MTISKALFAAVAALAAGQALACYTVYDRNNQVVYSGEKPPVDMSRPLAETLPAAYPGGHMVFGNGPCQVVADLQPKPRAVGRDGRSPLLTDEATARTLGLPHTPVSNGVVLVPQRPQNMRPGFMLAESGIVEPNDTRAMGAGPARPGTAPARATPPSVNYRTVPAQPAR